MEEEVFQQQVAVTALRPQSSRHSDGIYTVVFQLGRPKKQLHNPTIVIKHSPNTTTRPCLHHVHWKQGGVGLR